MKKKLVAAGFLCALLAACGGGSGDGDSGTTPEVNTTAEGFWTGKASTGFNVALAVLDNGDTWGFYTVDGHIAGALAGKTTSSGNQFSGAGTDFNLSARTASPGTYSGTFEAKKSISVTLSSGATFLGSYSASYDQPASLSAIAGSYVGRVVTATLPATVMPIQILSTGAVVIPTDGGCSSSGSVAPHASGKNIFNLTISFSGSTCVLGNGTTISGVAYLEGKSLVAIALNSSRNDGLIYAGTK